VLVAGAVFCPPALLAAAVVCEELADCPTAAALPAGAAEPAVAAFGAVVPVTAAADSPLVAAAVVAAGGLPDSLPADELANWPVAADPVVDWAAGADSLVAAVEAVVPAVVGAAELG
jgi:hypothetical protein